MSNPFIGEIRIFGGNFAPNGWRFCDGSLIAISDYDTLFNLVGTTYGGDGITTFGLPDLRGRAPMHWGTATDGRRVVIGEKAGSETVVLTSAQLPNHTHTLSASAGPATSTSASAGSAAVTAAPAYTTSATGLTAMNTQTLGVAGGSMPHDNLPPYLAVNFIISLFGIYPSQS